MIDEMVGAESVTKGCERPIQLTFCLLDCGDSSTIWYRQKRSVGALRQTKAQRVFER